MDEKACVHQHCNFRHGYHHAPHNVAFRDTEMASLRLQTLKRMLLIISLLYLGYLIAYLPKVTEKVPHQDHYSLHNPLVTLRSLNQYLETEPTSMKKFPNWPQQLVYHNFDMHVYHRILQKDTSEKIPRIIHQTWATQSVPNRFVPFVEKWLVNHPNWQYWFWTNEDGERLARVMFPTLYPLYRKYVKDIHRVDVMKYMVLYLFGGVFADIDLSSLMPLDELTRLHFCIIAQEPEIHSAVFWRRRRMPSNAFMAARQWHPFFKLVLQRLEHSYSINPVYEVEDMTGQDHLRRTLLEYDGWMKNNSRSIRDTVYLSPPAQFMPHLAEYALDSIKTVCRRLARKVKLIYRPCKTLWNNRFLPRITPGESYTRHFWLHTYSNNKLFLNKNHTKNIEEIRPGWGIRVDINSVINLAETLFDPVLL